MNEKTTLYRTIWRWHFYAGMFVVPMVLILSITGAIYLFKPQVERWEEREFQNLPTEGAVSPDDQVKAALAAYPGARFHNYRLPERSGDAALIHLGLAGMGKGQGMRDVFVSPQGVVLGAFNPDRRIMQIAHDVHGQLLLGHRGSWLVELAASWAIVMILPGLDLWWPAGQGLAGSVWPRLGRGSKVLWRDVHAVTGFWVTGLALVLLLTGLPWADVWGSAFKAVRSQMGWVKGEQDWTIGGRAPVADEHAEHDHSAMMAMNDAMPAMDHGSMAGHHMAGAVTLTRMVEQARAQELPFPVLVTPPGAPGRFGRKGSTDWTIRSDTQNRPLRVTVTYDGISGHEKKRETFADGHPIDQVVGYGVAWHEGQLFGWVNQLIGVLTAVMLVTMSVTGFVMWRRRKPADRLGALPLPAGRRIGALVPVIVLLAALLPMMAISLVLVILFERLALPRMPGLARWMGMPVASSA